MRALGALLGAVLIATGVVATAPVVASAEAPAGARVGVVDGLSTRSFSDVPRSHRFYGDISWLAGEGITTGNADGSFAPKRAVTREAMAAFLYRYAGSPKFSAPTRSPFSDVPTSHRFYREIAWLASEGITTGNADGTFAPKASVTREAMAAFLYRYAGSPKFAAPVKAPFSDVSAGSKFAKQIAWLSKSGITTGNADGSFAPKRAVTREAMAAFLHRYDDRFGTEQPEKPEEPEEPVDPEPPVRADSVAFAQRNWTPTAYDTCPAELHEQYVAIGPDGKRYPTWHPAQVTDPATGQLCTFGHEHGADPATSDIYQWAVDGFAPDDYVEGEPQGLPFGYVSEQLDAYVHQHGNMSMRHEDNAGHKVFVANNVRMLDADRRWLTLGDGSQLVCDVLIKLHQGSWSADATANNAHEMFFAARCNDGTEILTSTLTRFGNANEMHGSCSPNTPIPTVGSTLPAGDGGKRVIPTYDCVRGNPTDWTLYEVWESDSKIVAQDGSVLAGLDPWFGIRNPSRMYDPRTSTATANGISHPVDLAWLEDDPATDYLWAGLGDVERFDYRDPRSPFDGAQRDFYLGDLQLTSTGTASGVTYSDPYGGAARPEPAVGSVAQVIRPGSVLGSVQLSRQKFDAKADYGKNNGVHAPN